MRERLRHLPALLAVTSCVAVLAAGLGGLAAGQVGALGALAGVVLVIVSYLVSTLAIAWADSVNPRLVLPVGLVVYVTKFSFFGAILIAVLDQHWAGAKPMAAGVAAGVVAWTGTQIWWVVRGGGRPGPAGAERDAG